MANPNVGWMGGMMDDMRIYNRTLSASDVKYAANIVGYSGLTGAGGGGPTAPVIYRQPSAAKVRVGGSASFNVSSGGATPLAFQWYVNGIPIASASNSSYTVSPAWIGFNGNGYACILSNSFGLLTSSNGVLTVTNLYVAPGSTINASAGGGIITH